MAAAESASPVEQPTIVDSQKNVEIIKEKSREVLMDQIKSKTGHYKSWNETTKAWRSAITERRVILDPHDRLSLQKGLDVLQKSIKVTSLQSMVERLDSITRQQGLKFTRPYNTECYISSDMFYVQIILEENGGVNDVKINHHSDGNDLLSCPELTSVLRNGNFVEFTKHLEGLVAIYQPITSPDRKQKSNAYKALQALEVDLTSLAQLQRIVNDPSTLVHKSPVGILQERKGGFSLKLTYFISPYDLLDIENKTSIPLTVDTVIEKGLGHSVTVCIESSTPHKLQTMSLISVSKTAEGKSLPSFAALSQLNSTTLPASFVLRLPEPIPMATHILKKIQGVTKIWDSVDLSNCKPLLSVIINDTAKGKLSTSDDLFVTLPDQSHCYDMKSNPDLQGVLVSAIPFTHPTYVPQTLVFLRQQMLFNTVISSCVRPNSKRDVDSALKFEVNAYSTDHIQVTFVHPLDESLAAVDIDLKEITNVKCKIFTSGHSDTLLCSDEYASKIMQRCLSIPVTMRAVIRKAHGQQQQMKSSSHSDIYTAAMNGGSNMSYLSHIPNYSSNLTNGSSFSGGDFSNLASRMCNKPIDNSESYLKNTQSDSFAQKQILQESGQSSVQNKDNFNDNKPKNPLLGTLLSQSNTPYQQSKPANTMLMSMLSDVPSATSNSHFSLLGNDRKIRKQRKRKADSDSKSPSSSGRSPKRKMSGEDETLSTETTDDAAVSYDISGRESFIKNELGYPHRSSSTDSYLMHNFQDQQALNESSRMSEGGTPSNSDFFYSQSSNRFRNIELEDDAASYSLDENSHQKTGEKSSKKIRKSKESLFDVKSEVYSGEDSSQDFLSKHTSSMEGDISDDKTVTQPIIVSTSLKIAKTGDGHKVSKTEFKMKQREGRRSTSAGDGSESSSKKKSEAKKERKRRRAESADGLVSRSPVRLLHLSGDSSLMPPPASPSPDSSPLVSGSEQQPIRTITLNMKVSPTGSSLSPRSKSPLTVKKSSGTSMSSPSKNLPSKTSVKPSSPRQTLKSSSSDSDTSCKLILPTSHSKNPSKHKQSSSTKGSFNISHGHSSPNKNKPTTLKLKGVSSHSASSNDKISSNPSSHALQVSSGNMSMNTSSKSDSVSPDKQGYNDGKLNKAALRCRKGSLSAVIDKLTMSAQHMFPIGTEKCENMSGQLPSERKEKLEKKENLKESKEISSVLKGSDGKNKYSSSDQFTVKQSSQGIKLTVTKTRSSDGSSKSGKSKTSSKNVVSNKPLNLGISSLKNTNPVPKKPLPNTVSHNVIQKSSNNPVKSNPIPAKTFIQAKTSSSTNPPKSSSKPSSSLSSSTVSQIKTTKSSEKLDKKGESKILGELPPYSKEKVSSSNSPLNLMPPPSSTTKDSRSTGPLNTTKRTEEKTTHAPLLDESDSEKAFRLLLAQSKLEGQNGSEQIITMSKSLDFSSLPVDFSRPDALSLIKVEEMNQWVSSTTDVNTPLTWSSNPNKLEHNFECMPETKHPEISSSNRIDCNSEDKTFARPLKQVKRLNAHSEEESSPEDGLVIDFSDNPRRVTEKKWSSPAYHFNIVEEKSDKSEASPTTVVKSPYPLHKSPAQVSTPPSNHSLSSSLSRPSPTCYSIEDDLMNDALMPIGK